MDTEHPATTTESIPPAPPPDGYTAVTDSRTAPPPAAYGDDKASRRAQPLPDARRASHTEHDEWRAAQDEQRDPTSEGARDSRADIDHADTTLSSVAEQFVNDAVAHLAGLPRT